MLTRAHKYTGRSSLGAAQGGGEAQCGGRPGANSPPCPVTVSESLGNLKTLDCLIFLLNTNLPEAWFARNLNLACQKSAYATLHHAYATLIPRVCVHHASWHAYITIMPCLRHAYATYNHVCATLMPHSEHAHATLDNNATIS